MFRPLHLDCNRFTARKGIQNKYIWLSGLRLQETKTKFFPLVGYHYCITQDNYHSMYTVLMSVGRFMSHVKNQMRHTMVATILGHWVKTMFTSPDFVCLYYLRHVEMYLHKEFMSLLNKCTKGFSKDS